MRGKKRRRRRGGAAETAVEDLPEPAAPPPPAPAAPPGRLERLEDWFYRRERVVQVLVVVGAVGVEIAAHPFLWNVVFPALGAVVGRVPVVSTVVGWLFGGGAFLAWGVLLVNRATAEPKTVERLRIVAWVWAAVAFLCVPTGYADAVSLPADFWAGAYASAYGVAAAAPIAAVIAGVWWLVVDKLFGHEEEPSERLIGWTCVGYAVLLLVWGSTLLRR